MKNIKLKAFLLKLKLRGDTSFEAIKKYAQAKGYRILFANTNPLVEEFDEYALPQCDTAYTYVSGQIKLIVINGNLSAEDIHLHLLHEVAHIELHHLDREILNSAAAEIEADALAYYVLKSFLLDGVIKLCVLAITSLIVFGVAVHNQIDEDLPASQTVTSMFSIDKETETNPNIGSDETEQEETGVKECVYITPTGSKYHTSECRYINPRTALEVDLDTAEKLYAPCSVCKP